MQWGYKTIGAELPDNVSLTDIVKSMPPEVRKRHGNSDAQQAMCVQAVAATAAAAAEQQLEAEQRECPQQQCCAVAAQQLPCMSIMHDMCLYQQHDACTISVLLKFLMCIFN